MSDREKINVTLIHRNKKSINDKLVVNKEFSIDVFRIIKLSSFFNSFDDILNLFYQVIAWWGIMARMKKIRPFREFKMLRVGAMRV